MLAIAMWLPAQWAKHTAGSVSTINILTCGLLPGPGSVRGMHSCMEARLCP